MTGTISVGGAVRESVDTPSTPWALLACWLLVPLTAIFLLVWIGNHGGESIRFLITCLLSVLLPGTLLWRALAGGRSVSQDLGFGAVIGLAWQVANWAACTALGIPLLQWASAAVLILAFALVPSLRQHLSLRGTSPVPPRWWHGLLVLCLLLAMIRTTLGLLRLTPLPPEAAARHQDMWYQLGIVQMLTRQIPPPDPSALGEPLIYHWFAPASMASASVMSDVDPPQVLMHQWPLGMALVLVLVGWAAGEALSGRTWVGPLAGVVAGVLPGGLQLAASPGVNMSGALSVQGPGSTMAPVILLALVGPTVLILRRQAAAGAWAAMILLLALAAGTKPTLLPIMLAGCVLAGVRTWYSARRPPLQLAALLGVVVAFLLASLRGDLTGSTGGSRIQFLAGLRLQPYYGAVTGDTSYPATGGWVVPSLASGDSRMGLFAVTLVVWYLVTGAPRLLCLLGLTTSPVRRDPAYWWLGGCVAVGTLVPLVFSHTGFSEYHFLGAVMALGLVGVVAVGANLAVGTNPWQLAVVALAGFLTAVLLFRWWPTGAPITTVGDAAFALLLPFAILLAVGVVVIVVVSRVVGGAGIAVQVIVLAVAASLPVQLAALDRVLDTAGRKPVQNTQHRAYLTTDEQAAMLWLREHSKAGDAAVTNVFCMPAPYRPGCFDDAYWVSALSGVQLYLGGWAYTPSNLRSTQHQSTFLRQPSPWPDRLQDSLDATRKPTPQLLKRLAGTHSIDWIVADLRAGPVSPQLDQLATLAYSNQDVRIFRLRP